MTAPEPVVIAPVEVVPVDAVPAVEKPVEKPDAVTAELVERVGDLARLARVLPPESPAIPTADPLADLGTAVSGLTDRVRALEAAFSLHTRGPAVVDAVVTPITAIPADTPAVVLP
jgi:hypothetical protein